MTNGAGEEKKTYDIPLKPDPNGWKRVRIQIDVLPVGSKERIVKLKEQFKVVPLSGDTSSYTVLEDTKKLINEGASVEFYVTVDAAIGPLGEQKVQLAVFQVEVNLDLSAMAQMMGAAVTALTGSGYLGGLVSQYMPQEMQALSGTAHVKAQEAVFELTLSKFRWEPLQKKLTEYVTQDNIRSLFQTGGELCVPVLVEPQQEAKGEILEFDPEVHVWDVKGTLNWFGRSIEGVYRDEEHTAVVFEIKPSKEWFEMPGSIPRIPVPGSQEAGCS